MPGIDYSKFDKIDDSDGEEDYDGYLRKTYGVTSDWKPGCGMQPPILGGRTPGQEFEECELQAMAQQEVEMEDVGEDDDECREPSIGNEAMLWLRFGTCGRFCFGALRAFQLLAWSLPTIVTVVLLFFSNDNVPIETAAYPIVMSLSLIIGFFDAVVGVAVQSQAEGPVPVAFSCWCKRAFLAYSFMAYESLYPMRTAAKLSLKFMCGLLLISVWTFRKVWGYCKDIAAVVRHPQMLGFQIADSSPQVTWTPLTVPGGRLILVLEAACELLFMLVHVTRLPRGTNFLGLSEPRAILALALVFLVFWTGVALRKATASPSAKVEHVE